MKNVNNIVIKSKLLYLEGINIIRIMDISLTGVVFINYSVYLWGRSTSVNIAGITMNYLLPWRSIN